MEELADALLDLARDGSIIDSCVETGSGIIRITPSVVGCPIVFLDDELIGEDELPDPEAYTVKSAIVMLSPDVTTNTFPELPSYVTIVPYSDEDIQM